MEEKLPPGFRFHPTDEELITYYLLRKVSDVSFTSKVVAVVDLNKSEPWDLPGTFTLLSSSSSLSLLILVWLFYILQELIHVLWFTVTTYLQDILQSQKITENTMSNIDLTDTFLCINFHHHQKLNYMSERTWYSSDQFPHLYVIQVNLTTLLLSSFFIICKYVVLSPFFRIFLRCLLLLSISFEVHACIWIRISEKFDGCDMK